MAITIQLAKGIQLDAAQKLVRKIYQQRFNVDIDELHYFHPESFVSDTLIAISSENQGVLGTMSVMYPNQNGIFPCESLFGFRLAEYLLARNNYVEIGRFATSEEGKQNVAVVISLFLGAIHHLQTKQINGWTAIVKDDVFNFLQKISLPLNLIDQSPVLGENDPLRTYIEPNSSVHLFNVSLKETAVSFKRFESYLSKGLIQINIA